ncbi:MAG: ammonium transporter [Planctomycetaceae bacterium]
MAAGPELSAGDTAWMLTAAALVLLMTPGLSFFYGGMVGFRNVVSTMLQSIVALGVMSVFWVVVGFSLAFGDDVGGWGIIGNPATFFMFDGVTEGTFTLGKNPEASSLALAVPLLVFAMFQLKFAIITPALITGAFAERVRFSAYLVFMVLFSLLIYCPLAHMTWHPDGLFWGWSVKDFAGGTVVHMSAGVTALAAAMVLGRRKIHLAKEAHTPANIPYVLLGTGLLWFGWFGFNAGSAGGATGTAAMAFATTNTASAAAMLAWMFFDWMMGKKPSALGACIGAVVGLVAITPAAGFVSVRDSIVIGVVASVVSNLAVHLRTKSTLDDTLDVFPCHGIGGIVGMILTGVFAKDVGLVDAGLAGEDGVFGGTDAIFVNQLLALVIAVTYTFVAAFVCLKLTDWVIRLRVTEEQELAGLDLSQHGETAMGSDILNGTAYGIAARVASSSGGASAPAERELVGSGR